MAIKIISKALICKSNSQFYLSLLFVKYFSPPISCLFHPRLPPTLYNTGAPAVWSHWMLLRKINTWWQYCHIERGRSVKVKIKQLSAHGSHLLPYLNLKTELFLDNLVTRTTICFVLSNINENAVVVACLKQVNHENEKVKSFLNQPAVRFCV